MLVLLPVHIGLVALGPCTHVRYNFIHPQVKIAVWLERIADGLEGGREEQLGLAAYEHGEAVRRSLRRFEVKLVHALFHLPKLM